MCNITHNTPKALTEEYVCLFNIAQEWTDRTLISHERTSVHFLVLPGSLLLFTEITEYTYISLI